jgi:hypothetical protein
MPCSPAEQSFHSLPLAAIGRLPELPALGIHTVPEAAARKRHPGHRHEHQALSHHRHRKVPLAATEAQVCMPGDQQLRACHGPLGEAAPSASSSWMGSLQPGSSLLFTPRAQDLAAPGCSWAKHPQAHGSQLPRRRGGGHLHQQGEPPAPPIAPGAAGRLQLRPASSQGSQGSQSSALPPPWPHGGPGASITLLQPGSNAAGPALQGEARQEPGCPSPSSSRQRQRQRRHGPRLVLELQVRPRWAACSGLQNLA